MTSKKFFNVNEIAEYLALSRSAIRKWIRTGQIPVIRLNGAIRFDIDEINRWVSKKRQTASNV